jgi:hypothetical protein
MRTTLRISHTVITLALVSAVLSVAAEAQRQGTRAGVRRAGQQRRSGWVLGVSTIAAPGISITGEDVDGSFTTNFGAGGGVLLGYDFTPTITGFAAVDVARQGSGEDDLNGSVGLAHLEFGVRVALPMGAPETRPYLTATLGQRALGARVTEFETDDQYSMSLRGMAVSLGGGFEHPISPRASLDLGASLSFGKFGQWESEGETDTIIVNGSKSIRLRAGIVWRP